MNDDRAEQDRLIAEADERLPAPYADDRQKRLKELNGDIKLSNKLDAFGRHELARRLANKARVRAINDAVDILRGLEVTPREGLDLAKRLGSLDEFFIAVRVLDVARKHSDFGRDPDIKIRIVQKRALFTYKDVTQPLGQRLSEALDFLKKEAGLDRTLDQETLGLGGAIYKRLYELDRRERHLRESLEHYRKGHEQGWEDQGYTSINAAFILDWLAGVEGNDAHRKAATEIREAIVEAVPELPKDEKKHGWLEDEWFFYSTVGEAFFGLGRFDEAHEWLVTKPEARHVRPPDWEFETTARQLASLVRLQHGDRFATTPAWEAFESFLAASPMGRRGGVSADAVARLADGKVGLALSGGGFRASLFHIGVLARLAELDVLRRVEVLSCVSGGSIVGAHYYLEVRNLLERKRDEEIEPGDYIEIVRKLELDFLTGVQTNIRTSVITESEAVRRMTGADYSRTLRLGELYEDRLFSKVVPVPVYMHEIPIHPALGDGERWFDFKPRAHNWRRDAKVPILLLNAATLNTGHNWQFTTTYMGEAPATIHREVDSVPRLRRKYYTEAPDSPEKPQQVRLGTAVAASSCVPVLFEPVTFKGLYQDRGREQKYDVRLVDGGVCDNQGVAGLLEQDCTVLLVSDGSGQLSSEAAPSALTVALRMNDILQARVRGTQYRELDARRDASLLNGLMFVHLMKDLDNNPVDWAGCPPESRLAPADDRAVLTKYGISKSIQRRLAAIRTDLDSFCDQEAFALMVSGYRMTEHEHRVCFGEVPAVAPPAGGWRFMAIEPEMKAIATEPTELTTLLDASSALFFKMRQLDRNVEKRVRAWKRKVLIGGGIAALGAVGLLVVGVLALVAALFGRPSPVGEHTLAWFGAVSVVLALSFALLIAVAALCMYRASRKPGWTDRAAHGIVGLLLRFGSPVARYYMRTFEKLYLARGKI